jgi:hypothetical protein
LDFWASLLLIFRADDLWWQNLRYLNSLIHCPIVFKEVFWKDWYQLFAIRPPMAKQL